MTEIERRTDGDLRTVVDQALVYAKTHGQAAAVAYLVENYVPSQLVERIMLRPSEMIGTRILL